MLDNSYKNLEPATAAVAKINTQSTSNKSQRSIDKLTISDNKSLFFFSRKSKLRTFCL